MYCQHQQVDQTTPIRQLNGQLTVLLLQLLLPALCKQSLNLAVLLHFQP
jgi:hypothetical protein